MAILITTNNPQALLTAIQTAATPPTGHLQTWAYDPTTQRFKHTTNQTWGNATFKAVIYPQATSAQLRFGIVFPVGARKERDIYSILHGRLIEMLLNHFHNQFDVVWPTKELHTPDDFTVGQTLV